MIDVTERQSSTRLLVNILNYNAFSIMISIAIKDLMYLKLRYFIRLSMLVPIHMLRCVLWQLRSFWAFRCMKFVLLLLTSSVLLNVAVTGAVHAVCMFLSFIIQQCYYFMNFSSVNKNKNRFHLIRLLFYVFCCPKMSFRTFERCLL